MAENRNQCQSMASCRDPVYIDTNRILDSCRDKDCFSNTVVYLSDFGQEIIDRGGAVRTKSAEIIGTNITTDEMPFNCGFYQVNIRMFIRITAEVCVCMGNPQEVSGIAVVDKRVILYGGEGSVNVFRSSPCNNNFCSMGPTTCGDTNAPIVVFEVANPVVLDTKIVESCECNCCNCCVCQNDLPQSVCSCIEGALCFDENGKRLVVSLGFFSVVRMERPAQFLITATEYSVPEKECPSYNTDDPCTVFSNMEFPIEEFSTSPIPSRRNTGSCSCDNRR